MIGQVFLKSGKIVATLEDDGRWVCADDRELEWFLNTARSLRDVSPADGIPGWAILDRVAAELKGRAEKEVKPLGIDRNRFEVNGDVVIEKDSEKALADVSKRLGAKLED